MPAVVGPWEMLRISAGEMQLKREAQFQAHRDSKFVCTLASALRMASPLTLLWTMKELCHSFMKLPFPYPQYPFTSIIVEAGFGEYQLLH